MIKLIVVGKIKEPFLRDAILEYEKRLSKYTKLLLIELPDSKITDAFVALKQERDAILGKVKETDYLITLELEGKEMNSLDFSRQLEVMESKFSTIVFIIGGSYGLHEDIKRRSHFALSFSKFTFPHQLFRVLLLEQVYRAYKIRFHETYHK